ncbi:hypothetical protein CIHG_00329 [Coccidioides immitis H538.4]|uniref:Uncharacterized protein n=2 Tax=Coccidioides immitis TaxID=5501 RepID=A0A0J8RCA6_COCIT|nr:hypothetical protein CIRG_07151 [Coccidioides immitis RMSCC 2394]KMU82547.1 hypothetical protein CIHG_00329 [Coccidioides immitis H538.4]
MFILMTQVRTSDGARVPVYMCVSGYCLGSGGGGAVACAGPRLVKPGCLSGGEGRRWQEKARTGGYRGVGEEERWLTALRNALRAEEAVGDPGMRLFKRRETFI